MWLLKSRQAGPGPWPLQMIDRDQIVHTISLYRSHAHINSTKKSYYLLRGQAVRDFLQKYKVKAKDGVAVSVSTPGRLIVDVDSRAYPSTVVRAAVRCNRPVKKEAGGTAQGGNQGLRILRYEAERGQ